MANQMEMNGKLYTITQDDKGRCSIKQGERDLGGACAYHGAIYAITLDAFPSEQRQSLRKRPN
jgi:hypothetical protein